MSRRDTGRGGRGTMKERKGREKGRGRGRGGPWGGEGRENIKKLFL